jgi:uncharacterized surface protein with fasciclin (FAS1) repeats
MRRLAIFFFGIVWLLIANAPTAAQGSSLAALIDNRSELSTLSIFLDNAPEMRELLEGSGAFTVLAPNDQAFDNLSSALGIPLADLLRSPEIVNALVAYHIIDGSYDLQALAGLSGQVIPTELRGAFVSVRLNNNQELVINNVVEVITPDIRASNGRLHLINDVLLNRVIDRLVEEFNIGLLITPNAGTEESETTPEATESPQVVATPVLTPTAAPITLSFLRIAHFAPEVGAVDIYLNEQRIAGANFGQISDFQPLAPDIYQLRISAAGNDEALVPPFNVTLLNGDFKTLILAGVDKLQTTVIKEDFSQITADTARVLFYQAVEGIPSIAIRLNGNVLTGGIGFAGRTVLDIPAADYDPLITASGDPDAIILDPESLSLQAGTYYLLGFVGTEEGVQWIQSALSSDELSNLRDGQTVLEDLTPTPTAEESSVQSILDTLAADGNFTILLEALNGAEDDVINRLASRLQESVTLLAPTDQAFNNLFSSLGLSQSRVFANQKVLSDILRYHVVEGEFYAEDFRASAGTSIPTLLRPNQAFFVTVDGTGNVFINGRIRFERVDIQASNGVIHVIDDVLLPQSALDAFGL